MEPDVDALAQTLDRFGTRDIARMAAWQQVGSALDSYTRATETAAIQRISDELIQTVGAFGVQFQLTIQAAPDLRTAGLPHGLADQVLTPDGLFVLLEYVDDPSAPQRSAAAELAIATNYLLVLVAELADRAKNLSEGIHPRVALRNDAPLEDRAILDPATLIVIQDLWITISRTLDSYFDSMDRVVHPSADIQFRSEPLDQYIAQAARIAKGGHPGAILSAAVAVTTAIRQALDTDSSTQLQVEELITAAEALGVGSDLGLLERLLNAAQAVLNGGTPPQPGVQWALVQAGERILTRIWQAGNQPEAGT